MYGQHEMVDILIKRGADFRLQNMAADTPSSAAVAKGHLEVLKVLVENGVGVDEGPTLRGTIKFGDKRLIHFAAQGGHTEVVKFLLEKGADTTRGMGTLTKFLPSNNTYRIAKEAGHAETA
jgi:ankyrin repeat protein